MRYSVVDALEYVTAEGAWWHCSQQEESVYMSAHLEAHSGKSEKLLHKGILQKVTFPLISGWVGFPRCMYYNAIAWQSLNSHQLSPRLQACMQPA